jgi:hypothetical protein
MKVKHNKKRNTAFVYEALLKEITAAIIKKDKEQSNKIIDILRKHFSQDSLLKRDLECYRSLYEDQNISKDVSTKILKEATINKRMIDPEGLFRQQTEFIKDVNKNVSPSVFNNFVPNYKALATINKMFNTTSPKEKVLLENIIIENMSNEVTENSSEAIDNLVYTTFVKRFNEKYDDNLLEEQRQLLSHYISSFVDNSLELKMFMNEEISRLKKNLSEALKQEDIKNDADMVKKTNQVIGVLKEFANNTDKERVLLTVLKTQQLVKEIYQDGSSS